MKPTAPLDGLCVVNGCDRPGEMRVRRIPVRSTARAVLCDEHQGVLGGTKAPALDWVTEKEWQAQVVELAQTLGWKKAYHVYDSRRSHSGWPDLVLVRERILYVELKREGGKPPPPPIVVPPAPPADLVGQARAHVRAALDLLDQVDG